MMQKENLLQRHRELAAKILNSSVSKAEMGEFNDWYKRNQDEPLFVPEDFALSEDEQQTRILTNIRKAIKAEEQNPTPANTLKWLLVAAVCVLVLSVVLLYQVNQLEKARLYSSRSTFKNLVRLGSQKPILILASGRRISLNSNGDSLLAKDPTLHANLKKGVLAYEAKSNFTEVEPAYNTLLTPMNSKLKIVLADGSSVWLNSLTTLRYPVVFGGSERKIELSGEAYFEVAKNSKKPFKVYANGVQVKVLGTHFNVMAYSDDSSVQTTLLEGSVEVGQGKELFHINPGQQYSLNYANHKASVVEVDSEKSAAWRHDQFTFENEDIYSIMRKLSRYYKFDVVFRTKNSLKTFTGTLAKKENIFDVLKFIAYTGAVRFKIEGTHVYVLN